MKVCLIHDWLTGMRGGERCLEVFCELYPDACLYTLLHNYGSVSPTIESRSIQTSFVQRLPFARTCYRYYLPIFPRAVESFSLPACDLVLSSSHCVAKGVIPPPGACHVSYIHTPMRYIWDQYEQYFGKERCGLLRRTAMNLARRPLQKWDVASCARVHAFLANSHHIAERISRLYDRKAEVIHPPIDWRAFSVSDKDDDFYLLVTALVPYKRVDLAIDAANRLNVHLKIIGAGPESAALRARAGPTIEFLGWQPDAVVRDHFERCTALLFPGEEDFGIVPLEAMACGKPVIAFGKGGVVETVNPLNPPKALDQVRGASYSEEKLLPITGVFFYEPSAEALGQAIRLFQHNRHNFDPPALRAHVARFDRSKFKERMRTMIRQIFESYRGSYPK